MPVDNNAQKPRGKHARVSNDARPEKKDDVLFSNDGENALFSQGASSSGNSRSASTAAKHSRQVRLDGVPEVSGKPAKKRAVGSVPDPAQPTQAINRGSSDGSSRGNGPLGNAPAGYPANAPMGGDPTRQMPAGYGAPQQYAAQYGMAPGGEQADAKDHSKAAKVVGITFGVIFAILVVVYLAGVFVFSDRLYPNTRMGELDVSMKSTAELRQLINERVDGYTLTITSAGGFNKKVTATEVGLTCDDSATLNQIAPNRNVFLWPIEISQPHEIMNGVDASYNLAAVQSTIGAAVDEFNKTATKPTSATIAFDATKAAYKVVPETFGTALDKTQVIRESVEAMANVQEKLVLSQNALQQPTVISTDDRMSSALAEANKMVRANVTYTMGGTPAVQVTPEVISTWVTLDDQCKATLNSELLDAWTLDTAAKLSTVGSERTYTRSDGKVITVSGGDYGWDVNIEAFEELVRADVAEGATKTNAIPCDEEGAGFTAMGGADWGKRYIDVDLSEQCVYFYDATGNIIWSADCISGAPTEKRATPQGVWYVKMKESPSKLIGYTDSGEKEYETTVKYWMPFEGNAVGFHDATWQPGFGGNMYAEGYGSHGCINLSYADAESLYGIIEVGIVVVVHE